MGLLALGLAGGCGDGDSGTLAAGESTPGPAGVSGDTFEVRVPSGSITVTVGEPVGSVTVGSQEFTAPEGGALVPVAWALDRYQTSEVTGFDEDTELRLVAGDEPATVTTIPDGATNATGSRVVAVGADTPVETVSATYAGLEQQVHLDGSRDAGVAEALYEPAAAGERQDCSAGWRARPAATLELDCTVRVWMLPYLPDAGWSEDGSLHAVVEPAVTLTKVTAAGEQYRATFATATAQVDGVAVDAPVDEGPGGAGSLSGRLVATDLETPSEWIVEATFDLRSRFARGPLDGTQLILTGGGAIG
ncbi:hypothetical protein [Nocardioides sp. SYSU D00065]|uniref:hypothetical protein n=1 Tax=Nocardioides sp. SYSU D00065 TaxID=2817378 RepID=UPI001B342527|nr:hypothetical protein [Nocardioides sp. SYSU D00065]